MNNNENKKTELRRRFSELDGMFDTETRAADNSSLRRHLASVSELAAAKNVFCYVSTDREPDTRELLKALLKHGRRVCVPRTEAGGIMHAVQITSLDQLSPNALGILEPPPDLPTVEQSDIDFAVVPGVAFDLAGNRLGRGGGYYDRWLAGFKGIKCGLCTELTLTGHLPHEDHDVKMDVIVTERRVLRSEDMTADLPDVAEPDKKPQPDEEEPMPVEYVRPRRRFGVMRALIYFLSVLGVSAALAAFGWLCADDVLALTRPDVTVRIVVDPTDEIGDIAHKLQEAELIKYPWLFNIFSSFTGAAEKIEPGIYDLNTTFDYQALCRAMRAKSAYRATVTLVFPEGFTLDQILQRLANNAVASYDELEKVCADYDFEYSFLDGVPFGDANRLEGYLFPNTYTFYIDEDPKSAIGKFLSDFSKKMSQAYLDRAEELEMSVHEVVTLASLIEKEAANTSEMSTVSSVIWNRLNSNSLKRLQIDATIQYILPERKQYLTIEDTEIDNAYNTYMYEGLPPGPICSPGEAAIKAALYPKSTDYYYYALTDAGVHEFAKTYEQQQKIIDKNPETYPNR